MIHTQQDIYEPTWKKQFPYLKAGYTTRHQGDMREKKNRDGFFRSIDVAHIVRQQQVHGTEIHEVEDYDLDTDIARVDALFSPGTSRKAYCLTVHVGDCVPLLFFDPKTGSVAAVHAGWKGTSQHIAKKVIRTFINHGSNPRDMYVGIGPAIGACCYAVDEIRASLFSRQFPHTDGTIVNKSDDSWYIDIGQANLEECLLMGITPEHIDYALLCTHCHRDEFFSFRRKDEPFGEIMGFIGLSKRTI